MKFLVTGGMGFIGQSVVRNLLARQIPVVAADQSADPQALGMVSDLAASSGASFETLPMDVGDFRDVMNVFHKHPDITHAIHLAYVMGPLVDENTALSTRVNILGMTHMFEAALHRRLARLVFTSSETVHGPSQKPYVERQGASIVCTRPPVVFGHGRKRSAVMWAEHFASKPAIGKPVTLPFGPETRDTWIYKDDCAEQLVRLALKPNLAHFAYNNGGHSVTAAELAAIVKKWLPGAQIDFSPGTGTPLIDNQDGTRLIREIDFAPNPLEQGVRAHINEARASAGLPP